MRKENLELNKYRVRIGPYQTNDKDRMMGMFMIPGKGINLMVISSGVHDWGKNDWEHVSISSKRRTPNWDEMCKVKDLFWDENETVIQFHPKKSEYRNCHPYCLHLWKKSGVDHELPPSILVAPNLILKAPN